MERRSDYLVIGSGIAGLTFALKTAERGTVAVVTKREARESSTWYAQGGIASVWGAQDRFDLHVQDTIDSGDGLCHRDVVELVVRSGPDRIRDLIAWGASFSKGTAGRGDYDLGLEGGHSRRRIFHAKDTTGREVEEILLERCRSHPRIEIFEAHIAVDLILESRIGGASAGHDRCRGAWVLEIATGEVHTLLARATLLATGGAGKVYLYTSNPDVATGDGVAMAFRAGAAVAGMEFFQFHPTCLYHPSAKSFLVSEAVRGEGGVLRTLDGRAFMAGYDERKDLAPRDVVARAIDAEMKQSGADHVLLDITHRPAPFLRERFPNIHERCLAYGIDITRQPIPVVPAAHYLCGGVATDAAGRSTLGRLYCAGETAFTGLHGANRLASNSLLEALVFAHRAAEAAEAEVAAEGGAPVPSAPSWNPGRAVASTEEVVVSQNWDELRRLMWNYVGIVRSDRRLERARRRIRLLREEVDEYYRGVLVTNDLVELRNITTVAELIVESASRRLESRGLHYTTDHPRRDDERWRCDIVLRKAGDGVEASLDRRAFG